MVATPTNAGTWLTRTIAPAVIDDASPVAAVPEPATSATMLVGFDLIGATERCHRRTIAVRYA